MQEPPVSARRDRVLVVDDELAVRELLADALETFGYAVRKAESAAEAFDVVRRGDAELVLSDVEMPGESGLSLLRRIKACNADVDVVMVTGATSVETAVAAIRHGASDYVTKPFGLE